MAATEEIYNKLMKLKEKGKIITVSMGDTAASGAYYISCAADKIYANGGTLTGSIGVIMSGLDLTGLYEKIGLGYNVIKSGKNKDLMASYRDMSDEEKQILTDVVLDAYHQFVTVVTNARDIPADKVKDATDGRVFSGASAVEYGLVDEIADFDTVVEKTAELAGIKGYENVTELRMPIKNIFSYLSMSFINKLTGNNDIELKLGTKMQEPHSALMYMFEM